MALITLAEQSKYFQNPLKRGVVEVFAQNSPILQYMPFQSISGNSYAYNQEQTLPGVGFRGINSSWTEDHGVLNPESESLKIGGGLIKIDRALIKMQGDNGTDLLSTQIAMKTKAMSLRFSKAFIKGDESVDANEFDGLEKRLAGDQVLDMGATDGGDALTLDKLDELVDSLDLTPSMLLMNKTMRRKVNALMRAAGQASETVNGVFGQQVPSYAGIPIGVVGKDNEGNEILDFDEPDLDNGDQNVTTSIYAVSFGSEGVAGIQNGNMEPDDQGYSENWRKILVEWYCGMCVFHPRAAARLRGISNA